MQLFYQKIPPPPPLRNYVRYYWTLEDQTPNSAKTFNIIADGCPGLLFNQSEKSDIYQNSERLLPTIFLYGQATQHAELNLTENSNLIGACFYPNGLKSIFGLDADELTDSCTDLGYLTEKQGFYLLDKLIKPASGDNRIEIISDYLTIQIEKNNPSQNKAVQYAISQIIRSSGNLSLSKLQNDLGLSERSLERKFKQDVGISPKLFSRIWRFQTSLEQLRNNETLKLSDIAYDNEYADQSHFIRAFRQFAGYSPNQLKKLSHEVGENLSKLKS